MPTLGVEKRLDVKPGCCHKAQQAPSMECRAPLWEKSKSPCIRFSLRLTQGCAAHVLKMPQFGSVRRGPLGVCGLEDIPGRSQVRA